MAIVFNKTCKYADEEEEKNLETTYVVMGSILRYTFREDCENISKLYKLQISFTDKEDAIRFLKNLFPNREFVNDAIRFEITPNNNKEAYVKDGDFSLGDELFYCVYKRTVAVRNPADTINKKRKNKKENIDSIVYSYEEIEALKEASFELKKKVMTNLFGAAIANRLFRNNINSLDELRDYYKKMPFVEGNKNYYYWRGIGTKRYNIISEYFKKEESK